VAEPRTPSSSRFGVRRAATDAGFTLSATAARRHGFRCHWFKRWSPTLDDALQALPPLEDCPPEVFRELATNPTEAPKRLGLVVKADQPVAVLSLRKRKDFWEPVTSMAIPAVNLPAAPGALGDALRACGLRVSIEELYGDPALLRPTVSHTWDVYVVRLQEDYEQHWRRSKLNRSVAHARNRTAHLSVEVDDFADVDWTIDRWAEIWRHNPEELWTTASDMKVAARWLMESGRVTTVSLRDNGERLAGIYLIARGSLIHGMVDARAVQLRTDHTGTRICDVAMEIARDKGFEKFDIGGLVDYKKRWAPAEGTRSTVFFEPPWLRASRSAKVRASRAWDRLSAELRSPKTKGVAQAPAPDAKRPEEDVVPQKCDAVLPA
jgi:hypothetical protein